MLVKALSYLDEYAGQWNTCSHLLFNRETLYLWHSLDPNTAQRTSLCLMGTQVAAIPPYTPVLKKTKLQKYQKLEILETWKSLTGNVL